MPGIDSARLNNVLDIQPGLGGDSVLWLATLGGLVRFHTESGQHEVFAFSSTNRDGSMASTQCVSFVYIPMGRSISAAGRSRTI